jgi:hypothetical protein
MPDYSYLGSGKVYVREIGSTVGFLEAGNCSALTLAVNEESKESKDFTKAGGGTYNEVKRISSVEASLTMNEMEPNNLARAFYGNSSSLASQTVSGESITVSPGAFSPFANLPQSAPTPTVVPSQTAAVARANTTAYALNAYVTPATANGFYYKATVAGTSGSTIPTFPTTIGATVTDGTVTWTCAGRTTLTAGTDYEVRPSGVFVYANRTIAGETWTVGYTRAAADVVQALTTGGKEYEMVFDGLNEARSGKRTRVTAYRVKLGAAQSVPLLGEDYAALEVSGKLLSDSSKTGTGISQYFRVEVEA